MWAWHNGEPIFGWVSIHYPSISHNPRQYSLHQSCNKITWPLKCQVKKLCYWSDVTGDGWKSSKFWRLTQGRPIEDTTGHTVSAVCWRIQGLGYSSSSQFSFCSIPSAMWLPQEWDNSKYNKLIFLKAYEKAIGLVVVGGVNFKASGLSSDISDHKKTWKTIYRKGGSKVAGRPSSGRVELGGLFRRQLLAWISKFSSFLTNFFRQDKTAKGVCASGTWNPSLLFQEDGDPILSSISHPQAHEQ